MPPVLQHFFKNFSLQTLREWNLLFFCLSTSPKYNKMRLHCIENRKNVVFILFKKSDIQHLLSQIFFAKFTTCVRRTLARPRHLPGKTAYRKSWLLQIACTKYIHFLYYSINVCAGGSLIFLLLKIPAVWYNYLRK